MRTVIAFLAIILFLVAPVSAATQINIYVDNIGDALFLGTTDANITLPEGVTAIEGRISGYTSNLTVKQGEIWTFVYSLSGADLSVTLPEGAVISSVSASEISLEDGQIYLSSKDNVKAVYVIERIDSTSSNYILLWIIIGLLVLIGVVYGWNYLKKHVKNVVRMSIQKRETRRENRTEKPSATSLQHLLHERENLILAKLKETGKTKMSYLRKVCDMPKASFSRHIHELEKKKLIVLSGEGKNKFVELA